MTGVEMSETTSIPPDRETKNIVLFALWSLIEALQLLVIVVFIFSFVPFKPNPFVETLFPLHQKGVLPEREMLFYRIFVLGAIVLQAGGLWLFHRRLKEEKFSSSLAGLTAANLFWLSLQIFCVFKMIVIDPSVWARNLFYITLAGAVLTRVFWPEVRHWIQKFYVHVLVPEPSKRWLMAWNIIFPLIIVVLLFVPDMDKVLARMFVRDQFYHLDAFLMAPAWAYQHGLTLNIDVISEYSVVMPAVVSFLSKLSGGLSYHNVVVMIMIATVLYFIGFYFFLRRWLDSAFLASFGVLLAIKLQMFHWGVSPLIWQFPTATVTRYLFDLPVLWCLWQHCRTGERKYVWTAGVLSGLALSYVLDTGIYLNLTFYFYLAVFLFLQHREPKVLTLPKDTVKIIALGLLPIAVAFFMLGMVEGPAVLSGAMYAHMFEHAGLFLQGWGALPMFDGLKDRQFFAFIMGFIIPVVYVWTIVCVGTLCLLRRVAWRNVFIVVLSVYGLALYHYFINRSAVSSYYVVCIPFVCVICYWIQKALTFIEPLPRRLIGILLLVSMFGALMTSYLFTHYPNVFNLSGSDWSEEKKFYKEEFNFDQDAALITRLTKADEKVALISSFETKILMDAKRKPFFYYYPLIESTHMKFAQFRGDYLHTVARMKKTLGQLEDAKPQYVFIERKYFQRQIPPEYYQHFQTLRILVDTLAKDYAVAEEGKYLVALKRK